MYFNTDSWLNFLEQPFYQYYCTVSGSQVPQTQGSIQWHSSTSHPSAETQPLIADKQTHMDQLRSSSAALDNSSANNLDAATDDSRHVCSLLSSAAITSLLVIHFYFFVESCVDDLLWSTLSKIPSRGQRGKINVNSIILHICKVAEFDDIIPNLQRVLLLSRVYFRASHFTCVIAIAVCCN